MSVACQINCVGGITYGPRACSKSFFLAVKPVTPPCYSFPIRLSFSMDEKEAEARPVMGTIFLVIGRARSEPHTGVFNRDFA